LVYHVFAEKFKPKKYYIVGSQGVKLEDFFMADVEDLL